MDKTEKNRIAIISVGIIFIATGISFTLFPAYIQYSDDFIISGILGIIIGYLSPLPKITVKKPLRASLEDSDGGKIFLIGIIMIVIGLTFGPLEFFFGVPGIGMLIIFIFFFGGVLLEVMGALMVTYDRIKET
jgi:energy-converting hydrogenase Eha subunit A